MVFSMKALPINLPAGCGPAAGRHRGWRRRRQPAPTYPDSIKAYVGAAKKQVKLVKMDEFKALFDQGKAGLIVDVRQENEFSDGYVPGAVNVPRGLIEFRIWEEVGFPKATDMNKQMTLYCKTGGRCALAAKTLAGTGLHQRLVGGHACSRTGSRPAIRSPSPSKGLYPGVVQPAGTRPGGLDAWPA
jgi:rhodanese-related sulfurtransferase